ncbi:MAG: hypothetical protein U0744_17225 [Gemmataceae bacterium]
MKRRCVCCTFVVVCASILGCSSGDWGTASGTVTLDSEPLKQGVVTFHPTHSDATAYGQVNDGFFKLNTGQKEGLKSGSYVVTVSATSVPPSGSNQVAKLLTPPKYANKATSDLKADVKAASNQFKFALRSKD